MNTDHFLIVTTRRPQRFMRRIAVTAVVSFGLATGCGSDPSEPASSAVISADASAMTAAVDAAPGGTQPEDSTSAAASVPTTSVAGATATSPTTVASDEPAVAGEGPVTDPCELLTTDVASGALGVPVGEPATQPGEGNSTCAYRPADAGAKGLVYLTTYSVTGTQAVLDEAARQFPDAEPVDGVGDAATISLDAQAIGVLSGDTVFALGLLVQAPDGELLPVDADQLITAANAVLDGQ